MQMTPPIVIPIHCLGQQTVAVCDQIRTVDKSRLHKLEGTCSLQDLNLLEENLRQVLIL